MSRSAKSAATIEPKSCRSRAGEFDIINILFMIIVACNEVLIESKIIGWFEILLINYFLQFISKRYLQQVLQKKRQRPYLFTIIST